MYVFAIDMTSLKGTKEVHFSIVWDAFSKSINFKYTDCLYTCNFSIFFCGFPQLRLLGSLAVDNVGNQPNPTKLFYDRARQASKLHRYIILSCYCKMIMLIFLQILFICLVIWKSVHSMSMGLTVNVVLQIWHNSNSLSSEQVDVC